MMMATLQDSTDVLVGYKLAVVFKADCILHDY